MPIAGESGRVLYYYLDVPMSLRCIGAYGILWNIWDLQNNPGYGPWNPQPKWLEIGRWACSSGVKP